MLQSLKTCYNYFNSNDARLNEALSFGFSSLNTNARIAGESRLKAFLLSRAERRYSTLRQPRYMSNEMIAERRGCNSPCQARALAEYSSAGIKET